MWCVTLEARDKFGAMQAVRYYWHVYDSDYGHMFNSAFVYVRPGNRRSGYWREVKVVNVHVPVYAEGEVQDIRGLVMRDVGDDDARHH